MSPVAAPPARGVYWLPYRDEHGHEMLIAIDRRGRQVGPTVRAFPRDDRSGMVESMYRLLDLHDPEPR
jgi:hypothetical protein